MYVGIQRLSETNAKNNWQTRLRESERRSKFVWVHNAEWWEGVWSSRSRETNPINVCWYRLSKTNTRKKLRNQAEGKWTQVKICLGPQGWVMRVSFVEQAKGNESYMYVGIQKLSETNANKFWQTRLRESEHRSNFVWVHKAEWWEWVWPRETNPICMLV
jgi:hypothetical protein